MIRGPRRSGGGARHPAHLLSGDTASSIQRTHLPTPPHPQRVPSLPAFSTLEAYSLPELPFKKNSQPQSKQKADLKMNEGNGGVPACPRQPVPGQPPPRPCLAPIPRVSPSRQPSPLRRTRARRLHHRHLALGPDLLCGGRQLAGRRGPHQVQLRAPQLRVAQAQAARPALRGLPGPRAQPARPPREGSPGEGPALSPSHKSAQARAGGRGLERSWLPGLLFEQNQRESRAAGQGLGGRRARARPRVGHAERGDPSPAERGPCAPGPAAPRVPAAGRARRPDRAAGDRARGKGARAALTGRLGGGGGGGGGSS